MRGVRRLPDPIAIDGPAASGKTTVGRAIAGRYGYRFLDTGLMYRAATLAGLRAGVPPEAEHLEQLLAELDLRVEGDADGGRVFLGAEDVTQRMRDPEVEANVSAYSALAGLRERMVALQQDFAAEGRVILAGRDIGTVVLPDAPLKFYLEASESARARRRGEQASQESESARRDISRRDVTDSTRKVSPLKPAADAIVIDTTEMTLEQVLEFALERVRCAID